MPGLWVAQLVGARFGRGSRTSILDGNAMHYPVSVGVPDEAARVSPSLPSAFGPLSWMLLVWVAWLRGGDRACWIWMDGMGRLPADSLRKERNGLECAKGCRRQRRGEKIEGGGNKHQAWAAQNGMSGRGERAKNGRDVQKGLLGLPEPERPRRRWAKWGTSGVTHWRSIQQGKEQVLACAWGAGGYNWGQ